jgi:sugar phosphate isomerase/epimerase
MNRRAFLQTLAAAPAFAAPQSAPPIKLGFDTYSLRAFGWKLPQFLDYAHAQKLDTIQISSMSDYESYEPAYLAKMKDQAARYKLTLDAGMGCICPLSRSYSKNGPPVRDRILQGLRVANAVGATSMRCFLGAASDRRAEPGIEACMAETIKVFKSVRSEALDLNVKIALENHSGDLQAREVKTIIAEAGKDYVAACLDTGNPMWCIEDPFVTLETLAPWVATTHIRDSCVFETPRGAAAQWVALGDGSIDFRKFVADFRRLCPQSAMQIENITGRPPTELPYLEAGFWQAFPKMPAAEFARFVRLAKSGHPFMGSMVIADVPGPRAQAMTDALKEQQRLDLERSFAYARKILDIGVNWRA